MPPDISFVIPFKDEEPTLVELFERIAAATRPTGRSVEVIFVDDIDLLHMRRRLVSRLRAIQSTRDSETGFLDVVGFRTLRLPGWQRKQLEESE